MSEDGAQLQELIDEARHLNARLGQSANGNGGSATIHVNAGGVGLWVAVTCCVVMLASILPMSLGLYWVAMDSRDRGHQMNALYMSVPGLRELVDRQIEQNDRARKSTNEEKK